MAWITANATQLVISVCVVAVYIIIDRVSAPRLAESADQAKFRAGVAGKAVGVARLITGLFGVLVLVVVWGVDLGAVLVFASTTITLLGVALFASWSLLSNVTAYFVLLLHPSFRRGTFVRIIDADNYIEGYISELNVFSTKLVTENREVVGYPNNLLLGRPLLVNPRGRLQGIGKLGGAAELSKGEVG